MAGVERNGVERPAGSHADPDSGDGDRRDEGREDRGGFSPPPKRQAVASMVCVVLAMFLGALSQTVVATTMPLIIADLGGFDRYTWAATSYLVAATLAYPIVGRLSDIHGRRRFLLVGTAVFSAGSILLGFSESMTQVVAYRAVQGAGGGTIMTCCYVSVADLFRPEERGRFHGILSAVYGMSFIAGPMLGGLLADALSWKWAFLIIGFAGIPVLVLTARVFPKPGGPAVDRDFDPMGMIALVLAVPPLFVALSTGGVQYEWGSPFVIGMLLFSLAMTGVFVAVEARAKSPIMPLSLYADRVVGLSVVILVLASFGLYGTVLFLPLYFQAAFGFSAAQSGALLTPMLLGMVLGGVVAGQVLSGVGARYRLQALVWSGIMTAGLFLLSTLDATTGVVRSQLCIVIAGLGVGGIVATLSIGVQNHVPFDVVGVATSALQFFRSVGGMVGLAVLGVVLATRFSSSLDETVPEAAKAALAGGRLEELRSDPRALVDADAADRLRTELAASGPDGAALARELQDALGIALREALDGVFVVASIAAALSLGFALFFRGTIRSGPVPGDGNDIGSEPRT
ncbi:MAG: MDR family MFS transporter [Immundisolibacterales bacterium]|nr:MDR family MFS transporter [Immundisolibacterales bacterium]